MAMNGVRVNGVRVNGVRVNMVRVHSLTNFLLNVKPCTLTPSTRENKWFALFRDDGTIGDDTLEGGMKRDNFRLHPGTISHGCVTTDEHTFKVIRKELLATKTEMIPGTSIKYYGTITVD
jgi:hypothetical protein